MYEDRGKDSVAVKICTSKEQYLDKSVIVCSSIGNSIEVSMMVSGNRFNITDYMLGRGCRD